MSSLGASVRELARRLAAAGVDAPQLTAWLLAGQVLGLSREQALLAADRLLAPEDVSAMGALAARRMAGEPLAYILGSWEFFGLELEVEPTVLIPRPETEGLVELAAGLFGADQPLRFADLGTGSGAIGIALAVHFPRARGLLADLSPAALAVARRNILRHGLSGRLALTRADMRAPLPARGLDLVVSNPPYVSAAEYAALEPGVRDHEPALALLAGPRGLDCYPGLAASALDALRPGGALLVEIGAGQGRHVADLLTAAGFHAVTVVPDLAGLPRVVWGRRPAVVKSQRM